MLKKAQENLAQRGHAWFKATDTDGIARISIFGMVGLFSPENEAIAEVKSAIGDCPNVELEIDSLGGSGRVAFALYDFLKERNTSARITGKCASSAVIVAMASKNITIVKSGKIGLHGARLTVYGGARQLRLGAIECEKVDARFKEILWPRVKGDLRMPVMFDKCFQWEPVMFKADEAVQYGLADSVVSETQ